MKTTFLLFCALMIVVACDSAPPVGGTPQVSVPADQKLKDDFEKDNPQWNIAEGKWERRQSDGTIVFAQTAESRTWAVALLEQEKFSDVDVSVRVRPVSGSVDQSGGIVFRATDAKNYYLVRSNALEDNYRLYTLVDGRRTQIASTTVDPPPAGAWHTLRVVAKGKHIQAYMDGKLLIDHEDSTFLEGYVGLWTKADSVTEFDEFEVSGAASK